MSNPTIGNESQFTNPYNILPDVLYTNPTTANNGQFTNPFTDQKGVPGTVSVINTNPTLNQTLQFSNPYVTKPSLTSIVNLVNPTEGSNKFIKVPITDSNSGFYKNQFEKNQKLGSIWTPLPTEASNISLASIGRKAAGIAASSVSSLVGIPQVSQVANSLLGGTSLTSTYATLTANQTKPIPGVLYADFRNRRAIENPAALSLLRLDGAAALTRKPVNARTALYAASSANPLGGAYAIFNLNGAGITGFGWGDHDNPNAIRNDFTLRSHVVKRWKDGDWQPSKFPEIAIPFRGDRVNVIDFGQRSLLDAYRWHPAPADKIGPLGLTQDFIKFYFTGPKLRPGAPKNIIDDIIVFRASITSLGDSFNATWAQQNMIGRADPNFYYTSFARDINLDFTVYATDRDELQPIWRKLNALASYTAPIYNDDITMTGPWMRLTIGDLFNQTPVILNSLSYKLHDSDSTWEINIEDDSGMMQVPHRVDVQCQFNVVGNELPQKGGRFYSLAKRFDENTGAPLQGNDNWLSGEKGPIGSKESKDYEKKSLRGLKTGGTQT
jgi:hypothetical protein